MTARQGLRIAAIMFTVLRFVGGMLLGAVLTHLSLLHWQDLPLSLTGWVERGPAVKVEALRAAAVSRLLTKIGVGE